MHFPTSLPSCTIHLLGKKNNRVLEFVFFQIQGLKPWHLDENIFMLAQFSSVEPKCLILLASSFSSDFSPVTW